MEGVRGQGCLMKSGKWLGPVSKIGSNKSS